MTGNHDLVMVLNHYGTKCSDGRSWQSIRCVLHKDSHASASISPDREMYFCFVCDFEGNVYQLIMEKEGLDYQDAINRAEIITHGSRKAVSSNFKQRGSLLPQIKGYRPKGRRYIPTRYSD
jgi:DNA primase